MKAASVNLPNKSHSKEYLLKAVYNLYALLIFFFIIGILSAYGNCRCTSLEYSLADENELMMHCKEYFESVGDSHTANAMCTQPEFLRSWVISYDSMVNDDEALLVNSEQFEYHCCPSTTYICYFYTVFYVILVPALLSVCCHLMVYLSPGLLEAPARLIKWE